MTVCLLGPLLRTPRIFSCFESILGHFWAKAVAFLYLKLFFEVKKKEIVMIVSWQHKNNKHNFTHKVCDFFKYLLKNHRKNKQKNKQGWSAVMDCSQQILHIKHFNNISFRVFNKSYISNYVNTF